MTRPDRQSSLPAAVPDLTVIDPMALLPAMASVTELEPDQGPEEAEQQGEGREVG